MRHLTLLFLLVAVPICNHPAKKYFLRVAGQLCAPPQIIILGAAGKCGVVKNKEYEGVQRLISEQEGQTNLSSSRYRQLGKDCHNSSLNSSRRSRNQ
eukprot:scaffold11051_cov16-Tisochrysis_lutea.AAC.2